MGMKKILFFITSFLISIILLEASLHLVGFIYRAYRLQNKVHSNSGIPAILCVGDSFTFGSGAEKGFSYPEQLERLLNGNGIRCRVFNEGIGGSNSSQILKTLHSQIAEYAPDFILVLTGRNDTWNLQDSNYYLFTQNNQAAVFYKLEGFLMESRLCKFFKILALNIRAKFVDIDMWSYAPKQKRPGARVLNDSLQTEINAHLSFAKDYWNSLMRNANSAAVELDKVLELDPENIEALRLLADINDCSGPERQSTALALYKKILELDPSNINAHVGLFKIYCSKSNLGLANEELKRIISLDPRNGTYKRIFAAGLPSSRQEQFDKLTRSNIAHIVALAKSANKTIILLTYPIPVAANKVIRGFSGVYGVRLVDNEYAFAKLQTLPEYKKEDYFVKDDHCNRNGYRIMVNNICEVLSQLMENFSERKKLSR